MGRPNVASAAGYGVGPPVTVRLPSIPASRWPGTVQKKMYLPGARLATLRVCFPAVNGCTWPRTLPLAVARAIECGTCEGLSYVIATLPGFAVAPLGWKTSDPSAGEERSIASVGAAPPPACVLVWGACWLPPLLACGCPPGETG